MYNDTGDNSDGFKIILHPDARAGPSLNPALSNGKFHAKYATTTPIGFETKWWL